MGARNLRKTESGGGGGYMRLPGISASRGGHRHLGKNRVSLLERWQPVLPAESDRDGRFAPRDVQNRPGLPPGSYEAVVVQLVLTEDLAAELHDHGHTVPHRNADYYTSPLRIQVSPETSEIEISLSVE